MASAWTHLVLLLRGRQRAQGAPLPIGEALHPAALLALVVLVANDWWWKPGALGRAAPALTGKLSDVAGLLLAPLVLSALVGVGLHGARRLGLDVDPSLRRARFAACVAATGLVFAAVKLWPGATDGAVRAWSVLGDDVRIVTDPTDLVTLPMLLGAWWIARRELARVPLGRVAVLRARRARGGSTTNAPAPALADVVHAGAAPAQVAALAAAIDANDAPAIDAALVALEAG